MLYVVILTLLRDYEKRSGKAAKKWTNATLEQKQAYLTELFASPTFRQKILYREFSNTTDYLSCTVEAIAQGIAKKAPQNYKATIIIDSLGKREGQTIGARLRRFGVHVEKVRGIPHKSDEFIRLADAMAGFTRDYTEGAAYARTFYQEAAKAGVIEKL
ncbi:hypothetical protein HY230_06130 [Candidatus Acetothermia bacterium]|nr:hypothetical protein [Candidatus Acetothermia bacterium]